MVIKPFFQFEPTLLVEPSSHTAPIAPEIGCDQVDTLARGCFDLHPRPAAVHCTIGLDHGPRSLRSLVPLSWFRWFQWFHDFMKTHENPWARPYRCFPMGLMKNTD